jgi:hypothetical protein
MDQPGYTTEEIANRGQEIYERRIRPHVEADNIGMVLVLDIVSEDYVIAEDHPAAMKASHQLPPDAILYSVKIGSPTMGRLGAHLRTGTS